MMMSRADRQRFSHLMRSPTACRSCEKMSRKFSTPRNQQLSAIHRTQQTTPRGSRTFRRSTNYRYDMPPVVGFRPDGQLLNTAGRFPLNAQAIRPIRHVAGKLLSRRGRQRAGSPAAIAGQASQAPLEPKRRRRLNSPLPRTQSACQLTPPALQAKRSSRVNTHASRAVPNGNNGRLPIWQNGCLRIAVNLSAKGPGRPHHATAGAARAIRAVVRITQPPEPRRGRRHIAASVPSVSAIPRRALFPSVNRSAIAKRFHNGTP